ncbi:membrane protein [Mycolicibacterium psychrotolerans]|uniref:Membrane protein n=2 Tax=Mycolicibacterium psychrotolerans TaxID=216929 RepID=A0A7I7M6V5_9MYCO|nr:membrane protein [Mycolicibacterium psychrotolerans]
MVGMSVRGWVLFAAMSLIWGIPYLLIKVAVEGVSVPVLVLARTAIGALVLIPLTLRRQAWAPVLAHWKPVVVFAFFEIIAAWLLLSDAERHLSSSLTGLLIAASPIVAALLDRLTGGEHRLTPVRLAGLGVGLAGVAALAGPELTGGSAWSVTEVLMVSVCYAIAPLVAARYLADVPTLPMTAACLTLAALVYAAPAAATWPDAVPETRVLIAMAALAVICTATAFLVFFALIREVGAARALVFTYVNPAVALAAGVLVLAEPLTAWNVAGLALILTGSVLATRRSPAVSPVAPAASAQSPR